MQSDGEKTNLFESPVRRFDLQDLDIGCWRILRGGVAHKPNLRGPVPLKFGLCATPPLSMRQQPMSRSCKSNRLTGDSKRLVFSPSDCITTETKTLFFT